MPTQSLQAQHVIMSPLIWFIFVTAIVCLIHHLYPTTSLFGTAYLQLLLIFIPKCVASRLTKEALLQLQQLKKLLTAGHAQLASFFPHRHMFPSPLTPPPPHQLATKSPPHEPLRLLFAELRVHESLSRHRPQHSGCRPPMVSLHCIQIPQEGTQKQAVGKLGSQTCGFLYKLHVQKAAFVISWEEASLKKSCTKRGRSLRRLNKIYYNSPSLPHMT